MYDKKAKVNVDPKRQPNQYSCVATSLSMALQSLGIPETECNTDQVNKVLGAMPLRGASWEQAAGAASHFGCRVTLVIPATLNQVKQWTDRGTPVLIAWNTGNEWSHASLIFDVTSEHVHIADPNIPNPDQTVRVLTHDEFYEKWWEKASEGYKIRRPAMAVELEVSKEGRQMIASAKRNIVARVATRYMMASPFPLAQAFVDQVGTPERMPLMKLQKILVDSFIHALSKSDTLMLTSAKVTEKIDIEKTYYSKSRVFIEHGVRVIPDEYPTTMMEVAGALDADYSAEITPKEIVASLINEASSGQFFLLLKREILEFFSSRDNKVLFEKAFNTIFAGDPMLLGGIPWRDVDDYELDEVYSSVQSPVLRGVPSQYETTVKSATVSFTGAHFSVHVLVLHDFYPDDSDFDLAPNYEPEPACGYDTIYENRCDKWRY